MQNLKVIVLTLIALIATYGHGQVIGGRQNNESTPKVAEATQLSGGGFVGDVNVMTGEYGASIPLGAVSTPAGINFSLELNYTSAFTFGAVQPRTAGIPYGDGWSPNLPTISIETDALHKFDCFQLANDNISSDKLNYNSTNIVHGADNRFSGMDEGDLYWFAPVVSIPGVASGRAIFKYVDVSDDNCLVFVLNKFETAVELRYYGTLWVVTIADGTRYEFKSHLANYRTPSNQRVLYYDQSSLMGANAAQASSFNNDYGSLATTVQNVIEPKASYSVWYCNSISNTMYPLQKVLFEYDTYGEFNYFKEFDQVRYEQVRTGVLYTSANTDFSAFSDIHLRKISSVVMESPVDIIELDYKTLNAAFSQNDVLNHNASDVFRKDSLYSYSTIRTWAPNNTGGIANFSQWKRYKHQAVAFTNPPAFINPSNPYLPSSQNYSLSGGSVGQSMDFDHGFLESERISTSIGSGIVPGDLYEVQTSISRDNQNDLNMGNGTVDIAIVTGNDGAYISAPGGSLLSSIYEATRGKEIFSTFNMAMKWQMGYQQGRLRTSNLFVMPNVSSAAGGFNIQIGPGNSDIDFGAISDAGNPFVTGGIPNVLDVYPHEYNNRIIPSTGTVPHSFGTGHPWGMMIPIFNKMALSAATTAGGSPGSASELYQTWWATLAELNSNVRDNIPTKFDNTVHLDTVKLIRYSKNPYMLQGVRVYKVSGEYSGIDTYDAQAKHLVSQKKLEYSVKPLPILKNKNYSTGDPLVYELYNRGVILLKNIREVPVNGDLFATDYGVNDTAQVLTTYLSYEEILEQEDALANNLYDDAKPYLGQRQFLLTQFIDHLGGITAVQYYPFSSENGSRYIDNYFFTDCQVLSLNSSASLPFPFGSNESYTAHAAVQFMGKNDEQNAFANPILNPFGGNFIFKIWEYQYNMDSIMFNPKQLVLPNEYFKATHIRRIDQAFSRVRVLEPQLVTGVRNYTDYSYYGNTDGTQTLEEFVYYGKLRTAKTYEYVDGVNDILHSEKSCKYDYTLAFKNAWERPNYMREQLGYDDLLARSYEYKDIYLGNALETDIYGIIPVDTVNGIIIVDTIWNYNVTGNEAKLAAAPPYLTGNYTDKEQAKLLQFYFYDLLLQDNPEYLLQSYFVKKTEELNRVYENSLEKPTVVNGGPPVLPPNLEFNNAGGGILNPIGNNPGNDDPLIFKIANDGLLALDTLMDASPLSDTVLIALLEETTIPSLKKTDVLAYQQGLSNEVWKSLIDNIQTFPPKKLEDVINAQPYFSDTIQLYLLANTNHQQHSSIIEGVMVKNDYITDGVITELTLPTTALPGEVFATIVTAQPQRTEAILSLLIASDNLRTINLSRALENQYMSDVRFSQVIADSRYKNKDIVKLLEETVSYPSDAVLVELLSRNPKLSAPLAERALAAANRELGITVLALVDELYPPKQAGKIKPPFGVYNPLSPYCNNAVIQDRKYIETKTEYTYYEADYTGLTIGPAFELLMGQRTTIEDPSPFPFTLNSNQGTPGFLGGYGSLNSGYVVEGLRLKHEPSWQIAAVKTSSPQHPGAYNREEYFYLYDLQNRYDRYWYNYDLDDPQMELYPAVYTLGQSTTIFDTLTTHQNYANYYEGDQVNTLYPVIPHHDGMKRSRQHRNRVLAFQKATLSKNSRDDKPLIRSEYYQYDGRWLYDDLPTTREIVTFAGDPCPPSEDPEPCSSVLTNPNCYQVMFKPAYMDPVDITPVFQCLWHVPGNGYFLCPMEYNLTSICGDAYIVHCNTGIDPEDDQKALPYGIALDKSLLLRDVTVQVDTLDHSGTKDFNKYKLDSKNLYIAEFFTESPIIQDVNNFDAPHRMLYPFDHLTVRTVQERNRYLQPELEENQVGLQTRYYYNTSQGYHNQNSNCSGDGYTSVINEDIGLPNRICVGYTRPDSLSTAYEYTGIGLVEKVTEPSGKFLSYTFDPYHRLTDIWENNQRHLSAIEYSNWLHDFNVVFNERTEENYVQTQLFNSDIVAQGGDPYDYELRKAFLDPLARNHSVVSAYYDENIALNQIHSGTVEYDNWGRVIRAYKNYTDIDPLIKATEVYTVPSAETIFENDPKSRALRTSNYGVLATANEVVKSNYAITNNVFMACELGLNIGELSLTMGPGPTANYCMMRTEIYDQDDKRSVEYTNALGQKIATLKYNDNNEKIVTLFVYDSYGNLTQVLNPEKQKSDYTYNILGQLTIESTVDAGIKHFMYNKQGLVSMTLDEHGKTFATSNNEYEPYYRTYVYDDYGRLVKVGRRSATEGSAYYSSVYQGELYGPLYYADITLDNGDPQNPDYITIPGPPDGFYFDYSYSNASTQDWLVTYDHYGGLPTGTFGVKTTSGLDATDIAPDTEEKVFEYGLNANSLSTIGKLLITYSCDNQGMRVQKCEYGYDSYDNISLQKVAFNTTQPVETGGADLKSTIRYPKYNYRNTLLEQKVDSDDDGSVDLHCFMEYDRLNRLVGIYAASDLVTSKDYATLLVSYEHDDANGVILKKKHYIDEAALNNLVNEIEYSYDVRDRLTEMRVGQFSAGFNPLMEYDLSYDNSVPLYVDAGNVETVNYSTNFNGNINGTVMKYDFMQNNVNNGPGASAFVKPTLYGYTYDDINRMTEADATIGDFVLQVGSNQEISDSYAIGDETVFYDKIGNIESLERRLRNTVGPAYTEIQHFNYVYGNGNNRLEQVTGLSGTSDRIYTYDANGNLLTDDYRSIDGTEYGRAAYAFNILKGADEIDYLYSVNDQRIYKSVKEPLGTVEDYYLIDAFGKTVALHTDDGTNVNWEYYISGAEREARLIPNANEAVTFEKGEASFFLYDHLGNTRVTYRPIGFVNNATAQYSYSFDNNSVDGWTGSSATVANVNGVLQVTTNQVPSAPAAVIQFGQNLTVGQSYTVNLDVDLGTAPGLGITTFLPVAGGVQLLSQGANSFTFTVPTGGNVFGLAVFVDGENPNALEYIYTLDNVTVSETNVYAVNDIEFVADYFPYGKVVRSYQNGQEERYLTTQHERDQETGLDYRGARYYDSDIARFLSLDPLAKDYPNMSDYNYVMGNPIVFVDPDGKSGRPVYNHKAKTVTVRMELVFYGSQATESLSADIANSVQTEGNRPNATIEVGGEQYVVGFDVSYRVVSEEYAEKMASVNNSSAVNFVRLEAWGNESSGTAPKRDKVGSNSYWLNTNDDLVEGKTAAHEILGHGFGIDHPNVYETDNMVKSGARPDISVAGKTETSEQWGTFNGRYVELDGSNRQVTQDNINEASKNYWGAITNLLFNQDGTYKN